MNVIVSWIAAIVTMVVMLGIIQWSDGNSFDITKVSSILTLLFILVIYYRQFEFGSKK